LPATAADHCTVASSGRPYAWEPRATSMVPSPLPPLPYKRCQEPHNLPPHLFPAFLWVSLMKNSFSLELSHCRYHSSLPGHPELRSVRSSESPSSSPSIHAKLSYITATACSNSDEFLPSQVHHESNASHGLQSLHSVHIIFRMKINPNSKKKIQIFTSTPLPF
jgi:hypothetical protein